MPSRETVDKAMRAIRRGDAYEYFFDNLSSPDWLVPLRERGLFANPPPPLREGEYVRFPIWAESRYLARIAEQAPREVADTIRHMPSTENVRVHEDLAEAMIKMPVLEIVDLVGRVVAWLDQPFMLLLPDRVVLLAKKLANGGALPQALELIAKLLMPLDQGDSEPEGFADPVGRVDEWRYRELVGSIIRDWEPSASRELLETLCDVLAVAVRTKSGGAPPEDHSYLWRPAIEESDQNWREGVLDALVSAIRDLGAHMLGDRPNAVSEMIEALLRRPWHIFHRLALHLLRVGFPLYETMAARSLRELAPTVGLDLHHEYWLLAHDYFSLLSPSDQRMILEMIDRGPEINPEGVIAKETIERQDDYVRHWKLSRLTILGKDVLPQEWQRRYDELKGDWPVPEHPEYLTYSSGIMTGPNSPLSTDQVSAMSDADLLTFLAAWVPGTEFMGPSPEGLARSLSAAISADPGRFANLADSFRGLDPTYVRALISGMAEAARGEKSFDWQQILRLADWVAQQEDGSPVEEPSARALLDRDIGWRPAQLEVARMLSAGLEAGARSIPFALRDLVWRPIASLAESTDPTPEHEDRYGGSNMDPTTLSLNTIRGQAMHTVVRYGLWVRRHEEVMPNGEALVSSGFKRMPEVAAVLENHLDIEKDPSLAVRAVYGMWLPHLVLLDRDWAQRQVRRVLPEDVQSIEYWYAAWESYLGFAKVYDDVARLLFPVYAQALRRPSSLARSGERLAEHLMVMYWRGVVGLSDPPELLPVFWLVADSKERGHALRFIGISLRNTETVDAVTEDRLRHLWESRLAEAARDPDHHKEELGAFSWWFASQKLDADWALDQLIAAARLSPGMDVNHLVLESLANLQPDHLTKALEVLELLLDETNDPWGVVVRSDETKKLLQAATARDEGLRARATEIINSLGARGYREFRDLLPTTRMPRTGSEESG